MSRTSSPRTPPSPRRSLERLLTSEEVAEYLGIPVATLYQWRHKGCGPDAYRVGKHLRYDPVAVRDWLEDHLAADHGVS